MNLADLLRNGSVKQVPSDKVLSTNLLRVAAKNLAAATDTVDKHPDWALVMAYNAMLSAGRALMAAKGYRTESESHHLAVVRFCAAVMPAEASALVNLFNRYRVRRHDVVYGETDAIGGIEASKAMARAKEFVAKVASLL